MKKKIQSLVNNIDLISSEGNNKDLAILDKKIEN